MWPLMMGLVTRTFPSEHDGVGEHLLAQGLLNDMPRAFTGCTHVINPKLLENRGNLDAVASSAHHKDVLPDFD